MKLLIVEPYPGGHHFVPYLLFLAKAAMARGIEVRLMTTASAMRHPAFAVLQASLPAPLPVDPMPELPRMEGASGLFGQMRRQWDYWDVMARGFSRLPANARPDHVFLLSMDSLDRVMALRGSPFGKTPFSGLFVHLKFHWASLGVGPAGRFPAIHQWLLSRLLKMCSLHALATIDESLPEWWQARHPRCAHKLRFVPDPGHIRLEEDRQTARRKLGIAADAFVVLLYGRISSRKNVAALLRALFAGGNAVAVLAGQVEQSDAHLPQSDDAKALRDQGRLLVLDRFIDLDEEQRLFCATDVVWLGYARSEWGQSAILAQAASAGRPVLAREGGWIGWMTQRHRLGLCVDPEDAEQVNAALEKLRPRRALAEEIRAAASEFARGRSEGAFAHAILNCIPAQ